MVFIYVRQTLVKLTILILTQCQKFRMLGNAGPYDWQSWAHFHNILNLKEQVNGQQ